MRNPFARLAKCDTARPSLRERAATLKASAARVIRRKPVDAEAIHVDLPDASMGEADGSGLVFYTDINGQARREPVARWIAWTAANLDCIARREVSRQFNAACNDLSSAECDALYDRLRKEHRIDALHDLACRSDRLFEARKHLSVGGYWQAISAAADVELLALGRQFEAARLAEEAADRALSDADERAGAARPAKPDSLVFRASDRDCGLRQRHMHPDAWEGLEVFHEDIAWMRKRTFTHEVWREAREGERAWHGHDGKLPEIQPYPEAEARAAELVGIWDAWQAECDRNEAECGVPAAADASSAAFIATKAIAAQIAAIPARTAEGLKVKIRALDFCAYQASKDDPDAILMRSLARDASSAAPDASSPPDPVLAVLAHYQAARSASDAYCDRLENEGWDALGGIKIASDEESRLGRVWSDLSTEVLATTPSTEAGRLALVAFIETWVDSHGNADGSPQDGSETVFAEVYPALLKALRASVMVQG